MVKKSTQQTQGERNRKGKGRENPKKNTKIKVDNQGRTDVFQ